MSRQKNSFTQLFVFLVICSLTLVVGDRNNWWANVREAVEGKIVGRRVNHRETEQEKLAQLESKVVALEHTNTQITQENESLRRQLAAPFPPKLEFIPGYVISIKISGDDAALTLAAGEKDGVAQGMGVVSENILIGFVDQTSPRMSTARLLSSTHSKVSVTTSSGAKGLLVGAEEKDRPDYAIVDRVLQTEQLAVGDKVVTSGEDAVPPNLVIGEVTEILSESRDAFQRAKVALAVKPNLTKRVFVIRD